MTAGSVPMARERDRERGNEGVQRKLWRSRAGSVANVIETCWQHCPPSLPFSLSLSFSLPTHAAPLPPFNCSSSAAPLFAPLFNGHNKVLLPVALLYIFGCKLWLQGAWQPQRLQLWHCPALAADLNGFCTQLAAPFISFY